VVHGEPIEDFEIGKAITIIDGCDVCLLSTGNMLGEVIAAARGLEGKGISVRVVSFHTVKPLDEACLREAFDRFALVAALEEHSRIGGFSSAVAEWLVDEGIAPRKFMRFGTPDAFFKQSGEQEFAREMLGLSAHRIVEEIVHELR
jgi:transketolase